MMVFGAKVAWVLSALVIAPMGELRAQDASDRPEGAGPTPAATQPSQTTPTGSDRPGPAGFNPFGDPKRFNRYGGWGGIGGTMGQWGLGRSMLVMMPAVQKELKLEDDQKQSLREWAEQMRDRLQGSSQELRDEGEAAFRRMDVTAVLRLMGSVSELVRENEAGIARILTRSQGKRLEQLALQMEGITAIARPEIAERLQLTEEQAEQVHAILAESRGRQIGFWLQQMMRMRQTVRREEPRTEEPATGLSGPTPAGTYRRKPGADSRNVAGDSAKPASTATSADPEQEQKRSEASDAPDQDLRRAERRKQMQAQFQTMRDGADQLQEETVAQILRVLAPKQRSAFERLLGPPFDPSTLLSQPASAGLSDDSTRPRPRADAQSESEETPRPLRRRPPPRVRSATGTTAGAADREAPK